MVLRAKNVAVYISNPLLCSSIGGAIPTGTGPGGISPKPKWWVRQDSHLAARLSDFSGSLESEQTCAVSCPDIWGEVTRKESH